MSEHINLIDVRYNPESDKNGYVYDDDGFYVKEEDGTLIVVNYLDDDMYICYTKDLDNFIKALKLAAGREI